MKLNPEQIAAAATRKGAYNLQACPGSGKTTTVVERVRQLFAEGATSDEVIVLTFSTQAAAELERRLKLKIPKTERGGFRTFHSFGLNLIRKEASFLPFRLSANPFPTGNVISKLLNESMKRVGLSRKDFDLIRNYISRKKRERVTPSQALENLGPWETDTNARAFEVYENLLREAGLLDYDDMVLKAVDLLEIPQVRDRWQFKYVNCDEAQDTDDLQFSLLRQISTRHGNVFVVGDFCQALYGFRGARPENLLNFVQWFPNSTNLYLPTNYRSTQRIVSFCSAESPLPLAVEMKTPNELGTDIEFRMYTSSIEEAEAILYHITGK